MTKQYTISEARTHLASLIDDAESGEQIRVTRHGRPVAVIVSCREWEKRQAERPTFSELYDAFVKKYPPEEYGFDDDFAESVRDRSPGREVDF